MSKRYEDKSQKLKSWQQKKRQEVTYLTTREALVNVWKYAIIQDGTPIDEQIHMEKLVKY